MKEAQGVKESEQENNTILWQLLGHRICELKLVSTFSVSIRMCHYPWSWRYLTKKYLMRKRLHKLLFQDKFMIEFVDKVSSRTFVGSARFMPSFSNKLHILIASFAALLVQRHRLCIARDVRRDLFKQRYSANRRSFLATRCWCQCASDSLRPVLIHRSCCRPIP